MASRQTETGGQAETGGRDGLILLGILALALALRIPMLDAPLWFDEIATLETHLRLPWGQMVTDYSMNHHYLFSFEAKAAMALFGEAPWVLRLPALLFGLASIWAVWDAARRAAGPAIAHATALLLALSYHHIWFSQNARGYTELLFWSVLGTTLFLRALRKPEARLWVAYALVLAAAIWTHLTGVFFFMAHGMVWLVWLALAALRGEARREVILPPALAFAGGLALSALLLAPLIPGILETAQGVAETSAGDPMTEYRNPLWTMAEGVRVLIGDSPAVAAVGGLALLLVLTGAGALHRREPLIAAVTFAHVGITIAVLSILDMRIWPRFFLVDLGFLMLLLVAGVRVFAGIPALIPPLSGLLSPGRVFGLGLAAMAAISALLAARNWEAPKQDFAGAWAAWEAGKGPQDRLCTMGVVDFIFEAHFGNPPCRIGTAEELDAALAGAGQAGEGRLWIVAGFPARTARDHAAAWERVRGGFTLVREFPGTLGDGSILLWQAP